MLSRVRNIADDLLNLLYPRLCAACGIRHPSRDAALCVTCQFDLPRTDYHLFHDNPITRRLAGRFSLETATAMFYFVKDASVQHLLHRIKYMGRKEAALHLGRQYGIELKEIADYCKVQLVVPVPLHPSREHQRGYNQSAWFARGLAEGLDIPVRERALARIRKTETQTNKSRQERLHNTEGAFVVRHPGLIKGQHLLLVDDVMTTGATLEACAIPLLQIQDVKMTIVTLAIAQD